MFLLSVTRHGVSGLLPASHVQELILRDWVVTTWADNRLARREAGPAGVSLVERLPLEGGSGDRSFAFVRVLEDARAIEIGRTMLGGRQVYFHTNTRGEFFCSTHVRLLQAAGVPLQENEEVLAELFAYRYVTPPATLFKNISQLLPGQCLRFSHDSQTWRVRATEQYVPPEPGTMSLDESGAAASSALGRAMAALEPAREHTSVLASGGLDSSILFRLAQRELDLQESYSTGYPFEDEEQNVEKRYALTAAAALGGRHHYHVPSMDAFLRAVVEVVAITEEPVIFPQSVLLFLLFRDALPPGEGIVVLGQGADAIYGVRLHYVIASVERLRRRPVLSVAVHPQAWSVLRPALRIPMLGRAVRACATRLLHDNRAVDLLAVSRITPTVDPEDPRHVLWHLGLTRSEKWALDRFGGTRPQMIRHRAEALRLLAGRHVFDGVSWLDRSSDIAVSQALWSKLGESVQKIVYYPFNTRELIDSAFSTPWAAKLSEPKAVLRNVARGLDIPEFIVSRPKANFNPTAPNWSAPRGVFEPLVPLAASVWSIDEVRRVQAQARPFLFWTMLNHSIWKRLFIGGESVGTLREEIDLPSAGRGQL